MARWTGWSWSVWAKGCCSASSYAIAGVPHATVFGAITAVAAMIPFAAPLVFGVAALILFANGSLVWAIAVFCIGMATTFVADHFIRPVLIGGATRLPFIWVLLGILGGVEAWGADRPVPRPGDHGGAHPAMAGMGLRLAGVAPPLSWREPPAAGAARRQR